jgi:tetratricopeptide (TPR) repeat protein
MEKKEAIAVATATRAKPIMLTAIAIILGSLLLATDPIFGGLGIALIFGSIAATLVSLFFIPVLMDNAKALMPDGHEHDDDDRRGTWCTLTDNIKSLFPGKKGNKSDDKMPEHEDTILYEGYECEEDSRTTWCRLIDNVKSFFPEKKEKKADVATVSEDHEHTLTSNIDETKEKLQSTISTIVEKLKSLINFKKFKKGDEILDEYEKAKSERDFIRFFNLGNTHLEKKELDKAIESYEEALKIKEDEGVRFKIELAMLQKKKAQKKEDQELNKDKKETSKEKKSKKKKDGKE